jgi:hypothetical protein
MDKKLTIQDNTVMNQFDWIKRVIPCNRCNASGRLPQYNHIEGGICFKCLGAKYISITYKKVA